MTATKAQAIQTALTGDWNNAILLNQMILQETPDDIDALNRLAFAFASLGNVKEAKDVYQKVLALDVQNPIATRNLRRIGMVTQKTHPNNFPPTQITNLFIEEPGKTKVIELINIADKKVIAPLRPGELLSIQVKRMKIFVLDSEKQYIGMLPADIGMRILKFIEGGNEYEAYVKTVDNNRVSVFVRETKRASRFKHQPTFISMEKTRLMFDGVAVKQHDRGERDDHSIEDNESL